MKTTNRHPRSMSGFSMVELMIAMTLGLMLTAAILQTFVGLKETYEFQEEFSRIQENGRFGIEFLSRDIRETDFWGCNGDGLGNVQNHLNATSDAEFSFTDGVNGTNGTLHGSNRAEDQPDTLVLRGGTGSGINVVDVPATTAASIKISDNSGLQEDDVILISDCSHGEIFQVTNNPNVGANANEDNLIHGTGAVSVGPGNATQTFQKIYGTDAEVFKAQSVTYSIGATTRGVSVLLRNGVELVEGIENLQVLFGEDTNNDQSPNYYVTADQVVDMDDVISIQVSLMISSLRDNLTDTAQTVAYNGGSLTSTDQRIRKVFSTRVALRNRLN